MELKIALKWPIIFLASILLLSASPVVSGMSPLDSCMTKGASTCIEKMNRCLIDSGVANVTIRGEQFTSLLDFPLQNLRFAKKSVPKPYLIIIPDNITQVAAAVKCSVSQQWAINVRSGGHSYEGLSSTSDYPYFVLLDLMRLDSVQVNVSDRTAWVGGGATIGQVASAIAAKTKFLGFPAGVCPTMGTGGHYSGGGLGFLARKYGLSADNIVDAVIVDARGNIHNATSMGKDVFWAIRGGGGGSLGVIVGWKLRLVAVPQVLSFCSLSRAGMENVTRLVHRWQTVAPTTDEDLFVRAMLLGGNNGEGPVKFEVMYLGTRNVLLSKMQSVFPELGMTMSECKEGEWIDSVAFFASVDKSKLSSRKRGKKEFFKAKSDFVKVPMSKQAIGGALSVLGKEPSGMAIFAPLGGVSDKKSGDETPFPWRASYAYYIQYYIGWNSSMADNENSYIGWTRKLYKYMTPYVSDSPRASYVNYLDIDLGSATNGTVDVEKARSLWGEKYFFKNFDRLVRAKTAFDPTNVFRHAQSIPVGSSRPS